MGFETFQQLPSHNIQTPEFRPANIPAPPVYDTGAAVAPLLKLAAYLSPEARARRKAAIAKANYDQWLYGSKEGKQSMWYMGVEKNKLDRQIKMARLQRLHQQIEKGEHAPDGTPPGMKIGSRAHRKWLKRQSSGPSHQSSYEPPLPISESATGDEVTEEEEIEEEQE